MGIAALCNACDCLIVASLRLLLTPSNTTNISKYVYLLKHYKGRFFCAFLARVWARLIPVAAHTSRSQEEFRRGSNLINNY
jgi:hypothetical protein